MDPVEQAVATVASFIERATGPVPSWMGVWTSRGYVRPELLDLRSPPPLFDETEDLYEWASVLHSVMDAPRERFTMLELGAGWARWTVNAAAACRRWGSRYRLVAVEAEPTHARWARRHLRANGVRRVGREGSGRVLQAAVAPHGRSARFAVGDPDGWYGQALDDPTWSPPETRRVRVVQLSRLLRRLGHVDLVHADIQGAELAVFTEAAGELERVGRVHIGTHSAAVEEGLRELFSSVGFTPVWDFPGGSEIATAHGMARLGDGVQVWAR